MPPPLTNTCTVLRPGWVDDPVSGAREADYVNGLRITGTRCAIQFRSDTATERQFRETGERYGVGYFNIGADIQTGDRLVDVTGPAGLAGAVLEIDGLPIDQAGRGAFLRVSLRLVEGNT
jgi:hypothetical protein